MPTRSFPSVATSARRSVGVVLTVAGLFAVSLGPIAPATALAATASGAVISNGTVMLGVLSTADLNYNCTRAGDTGCPAPSLSSSVVGIRYVVNNTDAISPGCPCEGWGAADVGSGLNGGSNQSFGGSTNLTPVSFSATASTAISVVDITEAAIPGASMRVTHDYHPSAASPNLYEVTVTIENTGTVAFTDLRYRRVMDWDVEPTAFDEWVTIQNPGNSPQLAFDSDDGFASPNPLAGPSYLDSETVCGTNYTGVCTFTNLGSGGTYPTVTFPDDHGALFDFSFGAVAPGTSVSFKVLYGAAANRADAMTALTTAGAEVYSLGEPDCPESGGVGLGCDTLAAHSGVELGLPNTFMFAFVTTNADLRITKSDSPDPVRVGQDLTYTLTVQNAGPNAAAAVQVADTLPADVTLKSVTPSKGSCSGTTAIACDLGTVGNNATETVTIVVTPTKDGTLSNTATVSTASADSNLANNTSTTTTTVTPRSTDLAIVKTDAPDPVTVGADITYTLQVTNNGPDAATGVTASDTLPAGVTFKSASAGCVNTAGTVGCAIGDLASGASTSVTITVTTTGSGTISNTATVSGSEADPASANNSSTTSTTVNPVAAKSTDLAIVKTDAPDPVTVGADITYTLQVTNNGPDAATGVTASDTLPAGVTFKSASAGCVNTAGTVGCAIGDLASGASTSVTITVTTTGSGTISNTATVSGSEADPASANNSSTTSTTVNPVAAAAHLTLTKTVDNTWGGTAEATTWTLRAVGPVTVSGHTGDAAVTNAPVDAGTYTLSESGGPTGYVAGTWTCTEGSLAGNRLTLDAGQSATCSITNTFVPYLDRGSFVIGDTGVEVGDLVTYWSPSWWKANVLSKGTAPADFKGFAATLSSDRPTVGGTWSTRPGASSDPPKTVPAFMAVIVTSSVSESKSTISGDITAIVVVRTDATFGTGTVVAILAP